MAEASRKKQQVSVERIIDAPADKIFAILSDPRRHPDIDGSGTVQQSIKGPDRLELGSKFSMSMKLGVPYRMGNTVVEFEPDRRIAWHHFGKHRWRYELEPQADGRTLVRETFDWSTAIIPKVIELIGAPARNEPGMVKTLERLVALVEGQDPSHG
jgi:uncharacterized protein YndB with AHSA1/START domain